MSPPRRTTTDGTGSFNAEVRVPGLSLGNKNLKVTVNNVPVVEFLEIVAAPVVTTMASGDVFADLVASNNLTVVWHFDNATKAWSFYDPRPAVAPAVDLNEVTSGDNVWIPGRRQPDVPGRDADGRLELGNPRLIPGTATRQGGAAQTTDSGPAPPFSKGTWRNE